ncbi:UNVERIFIED_CONTAM: Nitrogen permease regulator-like 3, partial [Siphonaria sp. JEL0065]
MVFVGHPTLLDTDRPGTGHRFARQIQRKVRRTQFAEDVDDDDFADDSNINTNVTPQTPVLNPPSTSTTATAAATGRTRAVSLSLPLGASPISPTVPSIPSPHIPRPKTAQQLNNQHQQLQQFNLVFAIVPDNEEGRNCEVHYVYSNILAKLSAGLKYEQLKRGYIKKEIDVIMGIRDELHNGAGYFITQQAMSKIHEQSSLARLLAETFHAMTSISPFESTCHTHLDLNSSVDISILIDRNILGNSGQGKCCSHGEDYGSTRNAMGGMASGSGGEGDYIDEDSITRYDHTNHPPLRPYQAVLLLYHAEEILKSLPADSAPLLHDLIEIVTPTQSLENLAFALSCSLAQIYRLGRPTCHGTFVFLNMGNDGHSSDNFMINAVPNYRLAHLDNEFNVRVKDLDLCKMLSEMSTPRAFSSIFKDKSVPYLEIIALFLRNNLIEHCRMKLRTLIVIPKTIWSLKPEFESYVLAHSSHDLTEEQSLIVKDPLYASDPEKEMISVIAMTQNPVFANVFMRFVPYFDGKVYSEEMMYRENMPRKDFKAFT